MNTIACPSCGFQTDDQARFCQKCGAALSPAAPPAPVPAPVAPVAVPVAYPGVRYGGFWLRFVALIVDHFVLSLLFAPLAIVFVLPGLTMTDWERPGAFPGLMGITLWPIWFLLRLAYFSAMESSTHQATLGKLVAGLKVTTLDGRRITFMHAVGRALARIISNITLGIGYLMAGFTARKQALHDIIVSTLVVRR
jgi:uncharacterized RDD family membrane protein YckC